MSTKANHDYLALLAARRLLRKLVSDEDELHPADFAKHMGGLAREFPHLPEIERAWHGMKGSEDALAAKIEALAA